MRSSDVAISSNGQVALGVSGIPTALGGFGVKRAVFRWFLFLVAGVLCLVSLCPTLLLLAHNTVVRRSCRRYVHQQESGQNRNLRVQRRQSKKHIFSTEYSSLYYFDC